jgi:hypothetical protein
MWELQTVTIRRDMRKSPILETEFWCHCFISMDLGAHEDASLHIRGALAFFRGASCSVKSRDPIRHNRVIYHTIG